MNLFAVLLDFLAIFISQLYTFITFTDLFSALLSFQIFPTATAYSLVLELQGWFVSLPVIVRVFHPVPRYFRKPGIELGDSLLHTQVPPHAGGNTPTTDYFLSITHINSGRLPNWPTCSFDTLISPIEKGNLPLCQSCQLLVTALQFLEWPNKMLLCGKLFRLSSVKVVALPYMVTVCHYYAQAVQMARVKILLLCPFHTKKTNSTNDIQSGTIYPSEIQMYIQTYQFSFPGMGVAMPCCTPSLQEIYEWLLYSTAFSPATYGRLMDANNSNV